MPRTADPTPEERGVRRPPRQPLALPASGVQPTASLRLPRPQPENPSCQPHLLPKAQPPEPAQTHIRNNHTRPKWAQPCWCGEVSRGLERGPFKERANYVSQDAPRERRPSARDLMGNVVLLPSEFGSLAVGGLCWRPCVFAGARVHGSTRSDGDAFIHNLEFIFTAVRTPRVFWHG